MQKKIMQYLHLYLPMGRKPIEVMLPDGNIAQLQGIVTENGLLYAKLLMNGDDFDLLIDAIKPILRPLNAMVMIESDVYGHIYYNEQFVNGNRRICMHAQATEYLLSKHFDLFGLIEAGLAIDATTLEPIQT